MLALALSLVGLLALPPPAPPPPEHPAWQTVKMVDGVRLRRAPSERAAPWGLAEGEIAAPLERVVAHLTDFPGLVHHVPRLAEVRVLERGVDEAVVYFRFDLPWPISDRDWAVRYRWWRDGERWIMTWSDVPERAPPPKSSVVRVAPVRGRWELWPLGPARTGGRYISLAELGGRMPHSIVEQTAWKQPLQTFRGVRAATAPGPGPGRTP